MYLLDTNVCIYFMKNAYPRLTQRLLSHDPSELLISSLTVLELEYGAEKSNWGDRTRQKMALFLAPFLLVRLGGNPGVTANAEFAGRSRSRFPDRLKFDSLYVHSVLLPAPLLSP